MKPHLKSQQHNSTTLIEVKLNLSFFLVNSDGKKRCLTQIKIIKTENHGDEG